MKKNHKRPRGTKKRADPLVKKWKNHGEVRLNPDGSVDEICIKNCDVHLEQLGQESWWMGIGTGRRHGKFGNRKEMMHVNLFSKNLKAHVDVNCETEDGIISEGWVK